MSVTKFMIWSGRLECGTFIVMIMCWDWIEFAKMEWRRSTILRTMMMFCCFILFVWHVHCMRVSRSLTKTYRTITTRYKNISNKIGFYLNYYCSLNEIKIVYQAWCYSKCVWPSKNPMRPVINAPFYASVT